MKQIFLLLTLVLTLSASAFAQDADSKYATSLLSAGTEAPDFTLSDLEGKTHSLSELSGSYVVLDFWASWCPDCRKDIPELKRLYSLYGSKVRFVSISFDDKKNLWQQCVESNGMEWLQLSELCKWRDSKVSGLYQVKWIPSMYLIDPEGKVVLGTVMLEKIEKALKGLE